MPSPHLHSLALVAPARSAFRMQEDEGLNAIARSTIRHCAVHKRYGPRMALRIRPQVLAWARTGQSRTQKW